MKSERAFGAIDRLPSGNYRARWRQDEKRVTAAMTFATERDTENFLLAVEADLVRGKKTPTNTGSMTLAEYSEIWLSEPGKSRNSVARDRQGIKAFPQLERFKLNEITRSDVQEAVTARSKTVQPATVARDYSALRSCLNAAADREYLARPAPIPRRIALPKIRHGEVPELSDEDLDALVKAMPARYGLVAESAAILGLRWSEVIGLRICDIDFLHRTVTVNQTVEEAGGHVRLVPWGKTNASLRSRPVPQVLLDQIAAYILIFRADVTLDSLIFVGARGGILRRSGYVRRYFAPARRAVGLECLKFHHLRHHGITRMVEAGVPISELKAWFGHKAVEMVMHYTHATGASAKEAQSKMEQRWPRTPSEPTPQPAVG
jgi:integrase